MGLKKVWDLVIKITQKRVTMSAKSKRQKARLTYSKDNSAQEKELESHLGR